MKKCSLKKRLPKTSVIIDRSAAPAKPIRTALSSFKGKGITNKVTCSCEACGLVNRASLCLMNSRTNSLRSKEKIKKTKNSKSKNSSVSSLKSRISPPCETENRDHKTAFSAEVSAEKAVSSLDKCAVLLANILGDDVSEKIMSNSFGNDDVHATEYRGNGEVLKTSTTALSPPRNIENDEISSPNVQRASKMEERLKRSGCFNNSSLSNLTSQPSVVVPTALNGVQTDQSFPGHAGGGATFTLSSGSFSSKLRNILGDGEPGPSGDVNMSTQSHSDHEPSTMSQVLLTPKEKNNDWSKPVMHKFLNDYSSKGPSHLMHETVLRSESLATSTPRHNRSLELENEVNVPVNEKNLTAMKENQDGKKRNGEGLTHELELPSAGNPSEILDEINRKNSSPFSSNDDPDDDRSTVLLLKTLNEDKSLTLEQKLSLIATAGQVSMMNSVDKTDASLSAKNSAGNEEKSKADVNKVLKETLSKLSAETSGSAPRKNTMQFPSKDEVFSKSTLYDSNALRQRKLSAINEHLTIVNDVFKDLKLLASRKSDAALNETIEELENAISVMPGMIDKKIFENELKFTVEPLQEKVILLEGELAETRARLESMEKLHKESMENRQKEIASLKDSFNQQLAAEKLNCNKLKSAKFALEKDNEKLENEVKGVREQLKCQQMKLEKCSTGFTDEIREIRVEITAALNEVQKQKTKLGVAERQNEELNWSVEAKTEEVRTLEELAKKQHENISELVKELSALRATLQQQKLLSDTLAQEVTSLKSERNKFAIEAAKIRQSFDFTGLPNVSIAGTNFGKYPLPVPYPNTSLSKSLSVSRTPSVSDREKLHQFHQSKDSRDKSSSEGYFSGDQSSQFTGQLNGLMSQMSLQRTPKSQSETKTSARIGEDCVPSNGSDLNKKDECVVSTLNEDIDSFFPHGPSEHIIAHAANLKLDSRQLSKVENMVQQVSSPQNEKFQISSPNVQKIEGSPKKMHGMNNAEPSPMVNDHGDGWVGRANDRVVSVSSRQPSMDLGSVTNSTQPDMPASGRSVGSNSSSGTSHLVEFDLSFDTNSYSNFHIDSSENTPRNDAGWEADVLKNSNLMFVSGGNLVPSLQNLEDIQGHETPKNGITSHGLHNVHYLPISSATTFLTKNQISGSNKVSFQSGSYDNAFKGQPTFYDISSSSTSAESYKPNSDTENTTGSLTTVTVPTACANTSHHQSIGNLIYSRTVPPLDFSSLSNNSSALPSARSESKFQEGIKMLDADIQKLQNSIQQLFAVGQRD